MVIDSSVVIAILEQEPEAALFGRLIEEAAACSISAASVLEVAMVLEARRGPLARGVIDDLIRRSGMRIVAFDPEQLALARDAFSAFGRGHHPAKLNFGDCISYALARWLGEPLLFKGDDFGRTDIRTVKLPPSERC